MKMNVLTIQHSTWMRATFHFPFIAKPGLNVEIQSSENSLKFLKPFITLEIAEFISRKMN